MSILLFVVRSITVMTADYDGVQGSQGMQDNNVRSFSPLV